VVILDGLHPHQAKHVAWLLERPKAMLAWEMGVGKTAALLRAFECSRELGPALVLCLNTAKENWRREIIKFALDPHWPPKTQVIMSTGAQIAPDTDIVVVNYDKLLNHNMIGTLRKKRWGVIIIDEAHALKTIDAKRTRAIYGACGLTGVRLGNLVPLADRTDRIWLATGTPIPNHAGELYTHCRTLWPERMQYKGHLMEQWEFEAAFCDIRPTPYGMKVVGGRNLKELRERIEPVVSVIKRKDVLDLPPLQIVTWALGAEEQRHEYQRPRVPDIPGLLGTLEEKYGSISDIKHFDFATLQVYLACIENAMQLTPTIRRETAQLKAVYTVLTIAEEIENDGQKTVVFAHHREALATLEKGLKRFNPAIIHGGIPEGKRQAEIDRFQTDPKCRVFIGQITAAGSSINLQAATKVIFVEASWTPGDNNQALSRVYRMGQTQPVVVRFMYLAGSIDEAVSEALLRKMAMIEGVFGKSGEIG
jgi:SWI/SNF-related matrix-associated actin-dependent regulator 1 of chromatin subfamily A